MFIKSNEPARAVVDGRDSWVFPDGKVLPVVSGGDDTATATAPVKVEDLVIERARKLDEIDVVLGAAKEAKRSLTDEDREAIRSTNAEVDAIDEAIRTARNDAADADLTSGHEARRSAAFPVPNVAVRGSYSVGAGVTRDLDELLWATDEAVRSTEGRAMNPVEQVVIRSAVGDVGRQAPRIGAFRPEDRDAIRNFQRTVADMAVVGMMVDRDANTSKKGFEVARSLPQFQDRWQHALRAMDVDTSAEGVEWVPTGIGASLHEKVRAAGKVAALFARIDIPTNPWKWPIEGGDLTAYRVAEPTSDTATKVTASTAGSVATTFDAEILGARTLWSRSLDVDSAIAIAPYQQMKLVQAFVDAEEKAILDGDTDGTHQDTDTQAVGATHASSSWDGLRKKALAQTLVTATSTSVANLFALRAGMGKWGVNPTSLAYIVGVSAVHKLLADTTLLTPDKFGPNATIFNGQIGSIGGVPVIVSEHVREDLNATGVNDGITATKTYNLCVNRGEWAIGQRMALDIETNDVIYLETFQRVAVAFMREDFQSIASAATNDDTAMSYNVTP